MDCGLTVQLLSTHANSSLGPSVFAKGSAVQQGQAVQYGKESAKCVQGKYRQCKEGKGRQAVQAWLVAKRKQQPLKVSTPRMHSAEIPLDSVMIYGAPKINSACHVQPDMYCP